jgi:hypothetical protein
MINEMKIRQGKRLTLTPFQLSFGCYARSSKKIKMDIGFTYAQNS